MEHDEAGFQSAPEGPILCINNCGFFGSSATMNMCSKCHKDLILKQEQTKLAQTSIENIINGSSSSSSSTTPKELIVSSPVNDVHVATIEPKPIVSVSSTCGPSRCTTCKKRVGLTGFKCRCGNLFCGSHRYSEKHDCPFDYRAVGREEISKANPVVKAEKLDKI